MVRYFNIICRRKWQSAWHTLTVKMVHFLFVSSLLPKWELWILCPNPSYLSESFALFWVYIVSPPSAEGSKTLIIADKWEKKKYIREGLFWWWAKGLDRWERCQSGVFCWLVLLCRFVRKAGSPLLVVVTVRMKWDIVYSKMMPSITLFARRKSRNQSFFWLVWLVFFRPLNWFCKFDLTSNFIYYWKYW